MSEPVNGWQHGAFIKNLEFFSTEGFVILELANVPFHELSYSIVTNVTGTRIYLFDMYRLLCL